MSDERETSDYGYSTEEQEIELKESNRSSRIELQRVRKEVERRAIKAIAGASSHAEIKQRLTALIQKERIESAIRRYAKHEKLPQSYVSISKEKFCLEILLHGIFGKVFNINLDKKLVDEIRGISENLRRNDCYDIVYIRVSKLQSFIHRKYDQVNGVGSYLKIPVVEMRNVLSAARLNLNILDIQNRDHVYQSIIRSLTLKAVSLESSNSEEKLSGNIVIPPENWSSYK